MNGGLWEELYRERLEEETLERCREILDGRPVTVKSPDPRLRAQAQGVRFVDP